MRSSVRGIVIEYAELSHPGRDPNKQVNEDASAIVTTPFGHLAVVCDGMGGHEGGQEASRAAVDAMVASVSQARAGSSPADLLLQAVLSAGRAVFAVGGHLPAEIRPGSTSVAGLIHEGGAEVAHVGDSRMYLLRAGRLERVTRDHSMVQEMVDAGVLAPQDAIGHPDANRITRALGMAEDVNVELRPAPVRLSRHDVLLLASDGLTDMLNDEHLARLVLEELPRGPGAICQRLVTEANARGGHDNITVQIVVIEDLPEGDAAPTLASGPSGVDKTIDKTIVGEVTTQHDTPSPTLIDVPAGRQRQTTEPGVPGPPDPTPLFGGPPRPSLSHADADAERARRQRRYFLVWGFVILLVGMLLVFWIRTRARHAVDEAIPPPEPDPPADQIPTASGTPLPAGSVP